MNAIIDTHAHLDEIEDLANAITKAKEVGLKAIICVGSGFESNLKVLGISNLYSSYILPALGLHPWTLHNMQPHNIDDTLKQIEKNIHRIAAIGEIGLDYDKRATKLTSKEAQRSVLRLMLELASQYNKPVSLHSRYAWKDCFDLVSSVGVKKAVFHWFTGFSSLLREIIDAGYYISCTPAAEYHDEHRRAIKETPLTQLLLETDCPVTYGRELKFRSEPSDAFRSLKALAFLKEIDIETTARQTTLNAIKLFNLRELIL